MTISPKNYEMKIVYKKQQWLEKTADTQTLRQTNAQQVVSCFEPKVNAAKLFQFCENVICCYFQRSDFRWTVAASCKQTPERDLWNTTSRSRAEVSLRKKQGNSCCSVWITPEAHEYLKCDQERPPLCELLSCNVTADYESRNGSCAAVELTKSVASCCECTQTGSSQFMLKCIPAHGQLSLHL